MDESPLDTALRRPDAAWAREHLGTDVVAWLTTVAPDGRPQSSVISFLQENDTILFYSQPDTAKLRNLAHSAQVSFHLQSDPYGDHYLVIEGTAAIDPCRAAIRSASRVPRQVPGAARALGDGGGGRGTRLFGACSDHATTGPAGLTYRRTLTDHPVCAGGRA